MGQSATDHSIPGADATPSDTLSTLFSDNTLRDRSEHQYLGYGCLTNVRGLHNVKNVKRDKVKLKGQSRGGGRLHSPNENSLVNCVVEILTP